MPTKKIRTNLMEDDILLCSKPSGASSVGAEAVLLPELVEESELFFLPASSHYPDLEISCILAFC